MNPSANVGSDRGGNAPAVDLRREFATADDDVRPARSYANAASSQTNASPHSEAPFRNSGSIISSGGHVPRAKFNSKTAYLPPNELPNSVHHDRTYLLRLSGTNAVRVTARDICIALISDGALSHDEWEDYVIYYRYESPFERYIHLLPGAQFDLHHNTSITFKPASIGNASPDVELRVEDLSIKETTFFLEWVPMTYSSDLVEKLLSSVGLQPTSLRRDAHSADKWVVTVGVDQIEVPHYIHAPRFSLNGKERGHSKVLVTVPKRWTECEHCRSTTHRSHKCRNKRKRQNEQFLPIHSSQTEPKNMWVKPKQRKSSKKMTTKNQQASSPIPTFNRFSFPEMNDYTSGLETESEAAGDDDDFQSVASTPANSQDLFSQPPPGTFDFSKGVINPRKASLRKKTTTKEASKKNPATPSVRGSKKGVTNWFVQSTPARRGRPKTPRSEPPSKPSDDLTEQGNKRPFPLRVDNAKRSRTASPTNDRSNESAITVSGIVLKAPLTVSQSLPPNKVSKVADFVPSSFPEADALLSGDGLPPPPRPADTLGAGSDTGQTSQGSAFNDSQNEVKENERKKNNIVNP